MMKHLDPIHVDLTRLRQKEKALGVGRPFDKAFHRVAFPMLCSFVAHLFPFRLWCKVVVWAVPCLSFETCYRPVSRPRPAAASLRCGRRRAGAEDEEASAFIGSGFLGFWGWDAAVEQEVVLQALERIKVVVIAAFAKCAKKTVKKQWAGMNNERDDCECDVESENG